MATSRRLVVFNAHMLRGLIINDEAHFPDELHAFRVAFQGRRFPILVTDALLLEYQTEANKFPPFQIQPTLNTLLSAGRAIRVHEYGLNRFPIELTGLPQEHQAFVRDAIAAQASYLVTDREEWIDLSEQAESRYGLRIVSPGRFVELEG